jgi:hypothetical protein
MVTVETPRWGVSTYRLPADSIFSQLLRTCEEISFNGRGDVARGAPSFYRMRSDPVGDAMDFFTASQNV